MVGQNYVVGIALVLNIRGDNEKSLSWTWNLNLNFPAITINNKFKFQAQDSNLESFFGDLKIWKTNHTFWIKATSSSSSSSSDIFTEFWKVTEVVIDLLVVTSVTRGYYFFMGPSNAGFY